MDETPDIIVQVEGPDAKWGFYHAIVANGPVKGEGASRCPERAKAFALQSLADQIIAMSVESRGWT